MSYSNLNSTGTGIEHAVYLAIVLHMARKILRKTLTPKTRVKIIKGGVRVFQADQNRVREAARRIRSTYGEENGFVDMACIDVEALLRNELQGEIRKASIKAVSLSQQDIDRGLVSRVH